MLFSDILHNVFGRKDNAFFRINGKSGGESEFFVQTRLKITLFRGAILSL